MEILTFESQEKLIYQLKTDNTDYQEALKHYGYIKDGKVFTKSFPLYFPYKEKIINKF